MRVWRWLALLSGVLSLPAPAAPDLPPAGRSLFDELTTRLRDGRAEQQVPFPFARLLEQLERPIAADQLGRPGVPAVLIPIGRSLQRNASATPFAQPRAVVAVTGETTSRALRTPHLKDKLFLGYQESAGVLEVISYNETAGRYEFQVVKDYRPGGTPRVFHARRAVCTACHHAGAPIFSRPVWSETNANPLVRAALARHGERFYGIPVARGVDLPNAIDDAVARANRQLLAQTVWRELCAGDAAGQRRCRAAALAAVLTLRLPQRAADLAPDDRALLAAAWQRRWPAGLPEPEPNISNRDPYFGGTQRLDPVAGPPEGADEVTPAFDPLLPRPPAGRWRADALGLGHYLRALANLVDQRQVAALRRAGAGDDTLREAIAALAADGGLDTAVFRPRELLPALLARLGAPSPAAPATEALPAPRLDDGEDGAPRRRITPALRPFFRHCAACHDTRADAPPGFLSGDLATIEANLARCAPRIRYRLAMWDLPPQRRGKVPMPPPSAAAAWERQPPIEDLAHMRALLAQLSRQGAGTPLPPRYESLPPCRVTAATP